MSVKQGYPQPGTPILKLKPWEGQNIELYRLQPAIYMR